MLYFFHELYILNKLEHLFGVFAISWKLQLYCISAAIFRHLEFILSVKEYDIKRNCWCSERNSLHSFQNEQ